MGNEKVEVFNDLIGFILRSIFTTNNFLLEEKRYFKFLITS